MTPPKPRNPRYPTRCTILTPRGHWYLARLRLLAHLGAKCKVAK